LPQPPSISQVVDGVDFRSYISPGAVVTLFGNYFGPQPPLSGQTGTNGLITNSLGGDQVTFNGVPSPLLYVSAGQINAIVPYSTAPGAAAVEVITNAGSNTLGNLSILPTSLSLFPSLVFNSDGTLNSAANPAPKGGTLVMYGTGIGLTNPPLVDGQIVQGPPFPAAITPFSAIVQQKTTQYPATIHYLGPLPDFVAGAVQADVQLPATLPAGQSSLSISPAGGSSGSLPLTIYTLSDTPVLSGVGPPSPIPQSVGLGNTLTLTGMYLAGVTTVSFVQNGQPVNVQPQMYQACTSTACTVDVDFAGMSGQFGVTVANAANQVSNQLTFTVQPYSPPTVTGVSNYSGSGPIVATNGTQFLNVIGTNFLSPETAQIYYNGNPAATLSSSNAAQLQIDYAQAITIDFDFQGKAGQYAIRISGPNGSSGLFSFTATAGP
jgi:uncharacterized protein (TIGR03437 family)